MYIQVCMNIWQTNIFDDDDADEVETGTPLLLQICWFSFQTILNLKKLFSLVPVSVFLLQIKLNGNKNKIFKVVE